jgi:hypothetical protein
LSGPGVLLELRFCREDNTSSWENSRVDTISFVYGEEGRLLGIDVSALKTVVKYVLNALAFDLASE